MNPVANPLSWPPPVLPELARSGGSGPGPYAAKIRDLHRARLAIVYVRQSSPHQVLQHRESATRQYALAHRAVALGWPADRVLIIDEDQGQSGKSAAARAGFQRLVAEVTMNHVGLVLALEASRLARSNQDWHHLFELCAVFGALLADEDGVYDANDTNDRLLLGLKGMISEVELLTMRGRLERGRLSKAERGELPLPAPLGYVRLPSGELALDPDEQVRAGVRLLFAKFDECGSAWGVHRYLLQHGVRLSVRQSTGPNRGEVVQRLPTASRISSVLHHPIYAGAYVYGRRRVDRRLPLSEGGWPRQRALPMAEWRVLLRDRLPAYISWEQHLANQERLRSNRQLPATPGVARQGTALLGGLLVCGSCRRRLQVHYRAVGRPYYGCERFRQQGTGAPCGGLQATALDELVAAEVLRALRPAALELSIKAVEDIKDEQNRLDSHWQGQLERARYAATQAERQYRAVDAENRLVARTLEASWEKALRELASIEDDYDRFRRQEPAPLSTAERARLQVLAETIPALWEAEATTAADRKEIVRCLVERVVVTMRPHSDHVGVVIHWQGGQSSQHEVLRPVRRYEQLEDLQGLLERIGELRQQGHSSAGIAARLNQEGYWAPKCRGLFSAGMVRQLLHRQGLSSGQQVEPLRRGEWWLAELAQALHVPGVKLRAWLRRGWVQGRQTAVQGLWIVWADEDELERLRQLQACSQRGCKSYPKELITPKAR
jgi:DNA invertase Pin-like site-specific DNA recombinase